MRKVLLSLAVTIVAVAAASTPSEAQRRGYCPSSAESASYDIWPALSLIGGRTVMGRHPCGGRMRCWAATFVRDRGELRRCTWLH